MQLKGAQHGYPHCREEQGDDANDPGVAEKLSEYRPGHRLRNILKLNTSLLCPEHRLPRARKRGNVLRVFLAPKMADGDGGLGDIRMGFKLVNNPITYTKRNVRKKPREKKSSLDAARIEEASDVVDLVSCTSIALEPSPWATFMATGNSRVVGK